MNKNRELLYNIVLILIDNYFIVHLNNCQEDRCYAKCSYHNTFFKIYFKKRVWKKVQDGRGIGWGDHFLPYKFIERTFERWANSTKQLLITSRGHQVSRKAAHCLQKEVGQNIKDKKRDKRVRDGDHPRKGVLIEEVSKHQETDLLVDLGEVFESQRAT